MGQCPNCGNPTNPELAACTTCGTPTGTVTPPPPAPEMREAATPAAAAREAADPRGEGGAAADNREAAARPAPPERSAPAAPTAPPTDMGPGASARPAGPSAEDMAAAAAAQQFLQGGAPQQRGVPARETGPPRPPRSAFDAAVPAVVGLIVGILIQWLISGVVPADAYLYRLFRPAGGWIMSIVPGLIVFVFIWTVTDLFMKYRKGRANDRDLNRQEVKQLPLVVGQEPIETTLQRLRGWDQRLMSRPVGRRVVWLLRHLGATSDPQRLHELLRHQADLDTDSAASSYRTATLFIWAMPILGFVGTVLGISLAVGGFSDFLTTSVSIDEIDSVTAELGNVASGLSFAFDTTLLGLLAGLVASVMSSGVKEREERLYTGLDELGLRIMENAAPSSAPKPADPGPTALGAEIQQVYARLEELSGQMQHFAHAMRSGLEGLNSASAKMNEGLNASVGSVRSTVEQLGKSLNGVSQTLAGSLSGLGERVAASEAEVRGGLTSLQETNRRLEGALANTAEQMSAAADRLQAGVSSQASAERAMQQLSESITEFSERLAEFRETHDALAPALHQLAGPLELRLMPTPAPRPGGSD